MNIFLRWSSVKSDTLIRILVWLVGFVLHVMFVSAFFLLFWVFLGGWFGWLSFCCWVVWSGFVCVVFFKNVGVVLANCFCSGSFLYVGDL